MKRSDALAPVSREHHQALFVAQKLTRATGDTAAHAAAALREFWESAGRRHFHVEEDTILSLIDPGREEVRRIYAEHAELRHLIARVSDESSADDLNRLGTMLHDHIRYEERVVFPAIEAELSPAELERLGVALA